MKPLTIEQLKALEVGEWVWLIDRNNVGLYIRKSNSTDMAFHSMDENNARYGGRLYSDYGKTWLAYKNKEQAEAKGEIVELPCKVGDTVWVVYQDNETFENCIKESIAIEFIVMAGYIGIHVPKLYGNYQEVYATREQAEARLAELKGEKQ